MLNIVRFLLYNDPSRKTYTQPIPDFITDDLPAYGYGRTIQVGNNREATNTLPHYAVANISQIKREADPDRPDKNRIVYEVYLARLEDWEHFDEPEEFEQIRKGTPL